MFLSPADSRRSVNAAPTRPSRRPSSSSPTHEHLGLEWDPSVDIGRSVSHDDADSSYFSACTGRKPHLDPRRRTDKIKSVLPELIAGNQ